MKTGGMTLVMHLRTRYAADELFPNRELDIKADGTRLDIHHHLAIPYLIGLSPERRSRIRVYAGHFPYVACELLGEDLVTITLLRDPVDRTISLLRQFQRPSPWAPERQATLATKTLDEVYDHPRIYEQLVHNHQTKIFSMQPSDGPQNYMQVIGMNDARLERAKSNLAAVDVIGTTEDYAAFVDTVNARFGWAVPHDLRENATPLDGTAPATDALRNRIATDNALDVELHAYALELAAARRSTPA
jgi:hypothetical protein